MSHARKPKPAREAHTITKATMPLNLPSGIISAVASLRKKRDAIELLKTPKTGADWSLKSATAVNWRKNGIPATISSVERVGS